MKAVSYRQKRDNNLSRTARYILEAGEVTKSEISRALRLSMPTVLNCIKELSERGIIHEVGKDRSTGGRKPSTISVVSDLFFSIGIEITANHITFVAIDMKAEIIGSERIRCMFGHSENYYLELAEKLFDFIRRTKIPRDKVLGVGISIPGIIVPEESRLMVSHVLHLHDIDLASRFKHIDFPLHFENDANCAALAEIKYISKTALYLSLSNSVGGAVYIDQSIYYGDFYKSGEFGHMILKPGGRRCYCGKRGCMDAYCSARLLSDYTDGNLELFFEKLSAKEENALKIWDEYLEYLALAVSNLHLAFDCEIVLGGYVGSYIEPYMDELSSHMKKYLLFDDQFPDFLYPCRFKHEAAGVGIAMYFINKYLAELD